VALHLAAGPAQHRARLDGAGDVAAGARLHPGLAAGFYGAFFFGKITIALYWFLQMAFLAGRASPIAISAIRARSSMRAASTRSPTLVLGRAADAEVLLRAIESGAVKKIWPVGVLSPSPPIAASRSAAFRCSAASTISNT
jgi:FlaA1/EpsC-like NDP-sugar epimerase